MGPDRHRVAQERHRPDRGGRQPEPQTRPYGPDTLQSKYGITTTFQAIEDSGGSTTVDALTSDQIQLANVYTADPNIQKNDLVALEDPDGLFVADNVVPIVSSKITDDAAEVLNAVSAKLTADDLVALNLRASTSRSPRPRSRASG